MEPMKNCFTLVYMYDNQNKPSEKLINLSQLLDEIDTGLDEIFKCIEVEAGPSLISMTMARIDKEL
jgi:hypothetical protein